MIGFIYNDRSPSCNGGRACDSSVDLTVPLAKHYASEVVREKLAECHLWLRKDEKYSHKERKLRNWDCAYNLTVWEEFPGESISNRKILLQSITGGRMGVIGTGPTEQSAFEGKLMRKYFWETIRVIDGEN